MATPKNSAELNNAPALDKNIDALIQGIIVHSEKGIYRTNTMPGLMVPAVTAAQK